MSSKPESDSAGQMTFEEQIRRADDLERKCWALMRNQRPPMWSPAEVFTVPDSPPSDRPPITLETLPEELRNQITVDSRGCWLWQVAGKSYTPHGYGSYEYQGKRYSAHRLIWTVTVGEIPFQGNIDHLCERPRCVNPAHLELVTCGTNGTRYAARRAHENAFSKAREVFGRGSLSLAYGIVLCGFCGKPFRKKRDWQTYCSSHCRKEGWKRMGFEAPGRPHRTTRQAALAGESRVERAFREWIESEDGQVVEAEVVRRARSLRAMGISRWGIASLWESIRYDNTLGLHGEAGAWKLNNSYRSLLARRVMSRCVDLAGFFETRLLRGAA